MSKKQEWHDILFKKVYERTLQNFLFRIELLILSSKESYNFCHYRENQNKISIIFKSTYFEKERENPVQI